MPPQEGPTYQHPYRIYAERYGKSLPTIKRWAARGLPLDDPASIAEYFSPRGRKTDPDSPLFDPVNDGNIDTDRTPNPISLDVSFYQGEGIIAAIDRLKSAEKERAAAYFAAICDQADAQEIKNRYSEWLGIIEALRKIAKDEPEIRKANDLTIDRADLEASIGQLFNAFRAALDNLPSRAAAKIVGLTDEDEIVQILEREVEVALRQLSEIALAQVTASPATAPE